MNNIRNFCIIAHIDHGKSTLADRFLEITKTVSIRDMTHGQLLDTMDLEQERGITIKLQPVRMEYTLDNQKYILNLIDTPGHVDFSYEVSRSLAACEGAILVVDATQGIQAQTLANTYLALEHNLTIVPCLNKIDLPAAEVEKNKKEMQNVLGIPEEEIICISAKTGINIDQLIEKIIKKIPPPNLKENSIDTKALIFDSVYDLYKGVMTYVRVFEGSAKKGDKMQFLNTGTEIEVLEVGHFKYKPQYFPVDQINTGEIGYIVTGLKETGEAPVGDTIWKLNIKDKKNEHRSPTPLPGYKKITPFVFATIFCVERDQYGLLRTGLEKLKLNDASLIYEPAQSNALGHGFRCGFLGLLHLDIVQERLERENDLNLIVTAPTVSYIVKLTTGEEFTISNPSDLPDPVKIAEIKEPWVKMEIITPKDYVGGIMKLVQDSRGLQKAMSYMDLNKVIIDFEAPLSSIIIDFYDKLKSISSGYASLNYEFLEYRTEDLVKLDILLAGDRVEALASIIHRQEAFYRGQAIVKKLKELIPKAQFEIAIQAAIGNKVIARETLSALRKDVIAKLYGGDRTRKDKLLKKQKAGKKRLKKIGKIDLPQEAFLAILKKE